MSSVSTLLCFDFGLSNIGVAVGNTLTNEARPLTILSANNGKPNWDAVVALIEEWQPDSLVVGNPTDESGQATELSYKASRFARQLNGRLQLDVVLHAVQRRVVSGHLTVVQSVRLYRRVLWPALTRRSGCQRRGYQAAILLLAQRRRPNWACHCWRTESSVGGPRLSGCFQPRHQYSKGRNQSIKA